MRQLPWLTIILTAIVAFSPFGQDAFNLAFISGEQLSRNIWQPLYLSGVLAMVAFGVLEWLAKKFLQRRRIRKTNT